MKTIPLKKVQTESIAEDVQKAIEYMNKNQHVDGGYAMAFGYVFATLNRIDKQLKGEEYIYTK